MSRKKSDTWMPIYIGDYLADTMRLTTIQHGAYFLLLLEYWRQGPLPDDMDELSAVCRVDRKVWDKSVWPTLSRFFEKQDDGLLHQKRADAERANASDKKTKRSEAAHARWGAKDCKKDANASSMHLQNQCKDDDTQSSPLPSSLRSETSSLRSEGERADAPLAPIDPDGENSARPPQRRKSRLAENWQPAADELAYAAKLGLNGQAVGEKFRLHWLAKGETKLDWHAAFQLWCRREVDFGGSRAATPTKAQQRDQNAAAWQSGVMLEGY